MQRKTFLRILEHTLAAVGLVALGYSGLVFLNARWFQHEEKKSFEKALRAVPPPAVESKAKSVKPPALFEPKFHEGSPVALLEIPKLGLSAIVLEGTTDATLRRAVGHVKGTAFPWIPGNTALAGHRDTFFRPLRNIHDKDQIVLTTLHGRFLYQVDWTKIVDPHQTEVLSPGPRQAVTLLTCYPFYFAGHAPKRFIVHAIRIGETTEVSRRHDSGVMPPGRHPTQAQGRAEAPAHRRES